MRRSSQRPRPCSRRARYDVTPGALDGRGEGRDRRKGKPLFMPLRLALTGLDHGPELKALLPLIGESEGAGEAGGQRA